MTTGILNTALDTIALSSGAIAVFSEEAQRAICSRINRKAAQAAGIEALATLAIQTGDTGESLDMIAYMASELAEELQKLASLAGQMRATNAA
jgi:hypothetical protein